MYKIFLAGIIALSIFIPLTITLVSADSPSFNVTYTYSAVDPTSVDGDIVINSDNGLSIANDPYSNKIFGVTQKDSLIVYRDSENKETPVARSENAQVNVTNINGFIRRGDYITSSQIAGKGMKATQSGYVLGTALEDFSGGSATNISANGQNYKLGKIKVALRVEYAEIDTSRNINRLLEYVNAALFRNVQDPEKFIQIIRYLSAGLTLLLSFIVSFFTFSRTVAKGVEGIGRNPLAKNAIQFSMFISAGLTVVIVLIGIIASFVIIRF